MIYHVLPGDAQVDAFKQSGIEGEILVCREALVEGDVSGDTLDEFFINRAAFHNSTSDEDPANYNANVASQFRKLDDLSDVDEVNLWFEYELFCSVNLWFCCELLSPTGAAVYRVEPVHRAASDLWEGFGGADADTIRLCYGSRKKLTVEDLGLGAALWRAFRLADNDELLRLSDTVSPAFPYLKEICDAAVQRGHRPAEVVAEIKSEGTIDPGRLFTEFRRRAGIYGLGDSQVRRLADTDR